MCRQLTILARDSDAHVIAQCEHGTIHLFWVRANIFLHPDDLLPLLSLIQCWQPGRETAWSEEFAIIRQANGQIQLWCGEAGLRLSEADLYALAHLLWQAAGRLNLASGDSPPSDRHPLAMCRTIVRVLERPESRN